MQPFHGKPRNLINFIFVEVIDQFHIGASNSRSLRDERWALRLTIQLPVEIQRYKYIYRIPDPLISLLIARRAILPSATRSDYILEEISDKRIPPRYRLPDHQCLLNIAYNYHRLDGLLRYRVADAASPSPEKPITHCYTILSQGIGQFLLGQKIIWIHHDFLLVEGN